MTQEKAFVFPILYLHYFIYSSQLYEVGAFMVPG